VPSMRRRSWALASVVAATVVAGAAWGQKTFPALGPLPPVVAPTDNSQTAAKVELGKLLFFDPRLSGDASTGCAQCHDPKQGWGDGGVLSRGYPGTEHWRNAQTILNAAYYSKLFWDGSVTSLETQAAAAAEGNVAGNGDPMMMEERLRQIPEYVRRFKAVFGSDPLIEDAWRAIAAFERTLVSDPARVPFDRFMRGDRTALGAEAQRGLALFQGKAGCIQSHNGPLLSDQDYHNLGLPEHPSFKDNPLRQITHRYEQYIKGVREDTYRSADRDLGLYYITKRPSDIGKFRTPTLRELKYTAPYMHNGLFPTLAEVVAFYDRGGGDGPAKSPRLKPLGLTADERGALVTFLEALSSDQPLLIEPPELPPYAVMK